MLSCCFFGVGCGSLGIARALFDTEYCWLEFRPDASWILVRYDSEGTEHGIMLHAWCS